MFEIVAALIKIFFMIFFFMTAVAYITFAERKVAAKFQRRLGPNRAGPFGLLQPAADGIKLFFKEEFTPDTPHRFLFAIAPLMVVVPAICILAVIPFGADFVFGGVSVPFQVADINVGVLYILALSAMGVYGLIVGGWASNNKYSLRGALRGAAQIVSYEIPLGMALIGLLLVAGTLSLREMVAMQAGFKWFIFFQPLGFFLFFIASLAEAARLPFDMPEAEAELVGGYHTEYSSMKFGLFQMAEFGHMMLVAMILTTLYLGGWQFPGLFLLPLPNFLLVLLSFSIFMAKVSFLIFVFMWIRWTFPRFRYDQLMNLGWKVLIPLNLVNIFGTSLVLLIL